MPDNKTEPEPEQRRAFAALHVPENTSMSPGTFDVLTLRSIGRRQMVSRKKFTLVEMLVVVLIVVGLAALLVPPVRRAREAARRSACL